MGRRGACLWAAHQGASAAACQRPHSGKTPPVWEEQSPVGPAQFPRTFPHLHEHVAHPASCHEADPGLVELGGA